MRPSWSMRWAMVLVVLVACGDNSAPPAPMIEVASLPTVVSRELDVLFLIDDSVALLDTQLELARQLPILFGNLGMLDDGLPDVHVAVASSDLGSSAARDATQIGPSLGSLGAGGCAGVGKDGAFQISGAPIDGSFLIDEADGSGGRRRNYTGALDDVVTQMARLGSSGCGFEQHLGGISRALTRTENAPFRRSDANLAVVIFTDEDDCSFHDPTAFLAADRTDLGSLTFRCPLYGVTCDEPLDAAGEKHHCVPRSDSPFVDDIAGYEDLLRALSPDPSKLVVGAVVGPTSPVRTEMLSVVGGPNEPRFANVCTPPQSRDALGPAVRLSAFVDRFASHGALTTACAQDLSPSVREIARVTKQMLGVACIDTTALAQPLDCEAREVNHLTGTQRAVPFSIVVEVDACPETADHTRVLVAPSVTSADTHVEVTCRTAGPAR